MIAKTTDAIKEWTSPDGQRTIYQVTIEADGKPYKLKTFSDKISVVGFEGDVETYKNQKGDTFVKQKAKEGGFHGGAGGVKTFKADPEKQASIEAQAAVKMVIGLVGLDDMELLETKAREVLDIIHRIKGSGVQGQGEQKSLSHAAPNEKPNPASAVDKVYPEARELTKEDLNQIPF